MRNTILIIATVALTNIQVHATNEKTTFFPSNKVETITTENLVQVFDWNVKTTKRTYSGTSPNIEHANKMIVLVSYGEVILDKKIESFYMRRYEAENNSNRLYFWEVESTYGYAKGFSSSEEDANRMITLIAKGEIVSSKVIISGIVKESQRKKARTKI
ncbi:hypothetical protein [Bizionia arctica]|uniref:Uncharacterized protein n=1 Tax=Bizionia arctica TaxID=1495645 RepID=A0A917GB93_9FLAO|nr:hypothetical protein [Bizionia arctica]GGG34490.1 hypothetical protein GCM10010976_02710 [Bizionia arctica]